MVASLHAACAPPHPGAGPPCDGRLRDERRLVPAHGTPYIPDTHAELHAHTVSDPNADPYADGNAETGAHGNAETDADAASAAALWNTTGTHRARQGGAGEPEPPMAVCLPGWPLRL